MNFKRLMAIITIVFTVTVSTSGYLTSGFGLISKIDGHYAKASDVKDLSISVAVVNSKVDLNHLRQLRSEAMSEYFSAKKLKARHPDDPEVAEMLERAIAQRAQLDVEYADMIREVARLQAMMKK